MAPPMSNFKFKPLIGIHQLSLANALILKTGIQLFLITYAM